MSELGRWPISCDIPVQWGEMDALKHVNHTVFIRWMETARMHYFVACGFTDLLEQEGIGPILAGLNVRSTQSRCTPPLPASAHLRFRWDTR